MLAACFRSLFTPLLHSRGSVSSRARQRTVKHFGYTALATMLAAEFSGLQRVAKFAHQARQPLRDSKQYDYVRSILFNLIPMSGLPRSFA
jgi:hypothetical protein